MESLILTLVLAVVIFLAVLQRATRRTGTSPTLATIRVSDPAIARRALIDHADAFSNRPPTPFPVPIVTGRRRRRSDSITTVPYGPHWRALRSNLTAEILHPSRLSLIAPLQEKAVESLVADLLLAVAGGDDVIVRDSLHAAVFTLVARLCFGDGVDAADVSEMQRVKKEFFVAIEDAKVFAGCGSRMAKLVHWRRRRRFMDSRRRQAELFLDPSHCGKEAKLLRERRPREPPPVPVVVRDVLAEDAAPAVGRGTTMTTTTTLAAGTVRVNFILGDIGRDSKAWTDPDEFRPERFLAGNEADGVGPVPGRKEIRMMPFGAGRRTCPGAGFGMLHVKKFLAALVRA
ncbi:hypothetical protein EJB05_53857, partial [Eragrostis curvula]